MNPPDAARPADPGPGHPADSGRRARWWLRVGLVFLVQIGVIYALSDRRPLQLLPAHPVEVLNLSQYETEWEALNDPTLFALPNAHGAADRAWLPKHPVPYLPYRWSEAPRWLPLQVEELGLDFGRYLPTRAGPSVNFDPKPAPAPELRGAWFESEPAIATDSMVELSETLAGRRWLNQPRLPAWTNSELITNSVVQALVDPAGAVSSASLLIHPGSDTNSQNAALFALQLVRQARFERAAAGAGWTVGRLIFHWRTVPPASSPTAQ